MKNVSNEYKKTMESRRDFYCEAEITFLNGAKKTLKKDDFTLSGNSVVESSGSNSFPLGIVVAKQITLSLMNDDDQWSEYDFYKSVINLKTKFDLDSGKIESLNIGTFTVITPETYGTVVSLTAMDDSYKLDKDYDSQLTYPVSLRDAVHDSCRICGVNLLTTTFSNDNFVIKDKPENLTHRQFIGQCAMIAGGNARFDEYNRLKIMSYSMDGFETSGLDGGYFDTSNSNIYESGNNADGGSFNPWNTGTTFDGGTFSDWNDMHVLHAFKNVTIDTDDVVITGIKLIDKNKKEYLYGNEGYVLSLSNMLSSGQETTVSGLIGKKIVGIQFRPFSGEHVSYPLAEFMDLAILIDRNDNVYKTVITDIDFTYYGFTSLKCAANSPIRNSSKYYGNEVKAIIKSKKDTEDMINDYDKAVQLMTSIMANSMGMFTTIEKSENGGEIIYQHDKPALSSSKIIWKKSEQGFVVSTDGGNSWNAGVDASGNAVVNVLSAVGISFDWAKGGTLTLGGSNNANGVLKILNASGSQVGLWNNSGINAIAGAIGGWNISSTRITSSSGISIGGNQAGLLLINESGKPYILAQNASGEQTFEIDRNGNATFSGNLLSATGTFSGSLSAATGTFSGSLSAATGSFSGTITAFDGRVGPWNINGNAIYNGIPYTGQQNSKSTGIGDYGGNWAFWAGNGLFSVTQDGRVHAADGDFSGNINADSGTFNSVTINGSTINSTNMHGGTHYDGYMSGGTLQNTISNSGVLSGGTYSGGYVSGGSLGSTGGTYVGSCNGSTLSSCSLGNTTLSTGNGNSYVNAYGYGSIFVYGSTGAYISNGVTLSGGTSISGNCSVNGGLSVTGSKNRIINTNNYGKRCLEAYETPMPTFSDYGKATLNKNGECYIIINPIFAETVNTDYEPTVFLTKYGVGDIWVDDERTSHDVIVVCGTPKLKFSWETRYQQLNCCQERLPVVDFGEKNEPDFLNEARAEFEKISIDYEALADEYLTLYKKTSIDYEMVGALYYKEFERGLSS